jgi:glycosyltransferase involved in cell wall biosynthesis
MISVIIPAHNEEKTIGRCLRAILHDAQPNEIEIIVACNGCTDDTRGVVAQFGGAVRVVEIKTASKPAALNLGDAQATGFPRLYVDADVEISTETVRRLAQVLDSGSALVATPKLQVALSRRPWYIRQYFQIWTNLPYVKYGHIGSGVYALSEQGRRRFDHFPDIIADDTFVRNLFDEAERAILPDGEFVIQAPYTFRDMLRRKIRVFVGNTQLAKLNLARAARLKPDTLPGWMQAVRTNPVLVTAMPAYGCITAIAKAGALWRLQRGNLAVWGRDESTR